MRLYSIVLVLAMSVLASCNENSNVSSQEELNQNILVLQKRLMKNSASINTEQGDSMIALYKQYAEEFSEDSIAIEYLYRAAGIEMGMERNEACVQTLVLIQERYPKSDLIPSVLQLEAFIYDTQFQDYDKARAILDKLIKDYPNDKLTPNAKAYRDMIGKNPEDLFRKVDSTQALNQ
jgi:outer membrane protein assembly factor BamD (BamD/ComL family)